MAHDTLTGRERATYTELMKMTRSPVMVGVLGCAVLLTPALASAQALERAVYASVIDREGDPVEGLNTSAFVVREDGVAREVLRVVPASEPMQIAVLVDNSSAATQMITMLRQGLTRFITAMTEPIDGGGMHELAIITLASRPTIAVNYTTDREALLAGANRIFPETDSATYLLDALVEASQGLVRRSAMRPVIVSITTDGLEFSTRNRQQALDALDRVGGVYDAIVLGPEGSNLSDEARDREIVLAQGTENHGGHREILLTPMALPDQFGELAAELRNQYKVTYARPQTLIPPDKVTVAAADPALKAYGVPVKEADQRGGR